MTYFLLDKDNGFFVENFYLELGTVNQSNLMEFIRDLGCEEWGDCRGRAWSRSCHVKLKYGVLESDFKGVIGKSERVAINLLESKSEASRLVYQLMPSKVFDGAVVQYIGDT